MMREKIPKTVNRGALGLGVWKPILLTALLFALALQLGVKPVGAQDFTIASVEAVPRIVIENEAFTATLHGTYESRGGLSYTIGVLNIDGEIVGGPNIYSVQREDDSTVEGEWSLSLAVNPPTPREVMGHGIEQDPEDRHLRRRLLWACVQETGQRVNFYSYITDLTELYVDIVEASWINAEGEGEPVNPGDEVRVHLRYEVCPRLMPRREPPTIFPCHIKIMVGSGYTIQSPLQPFEWYRLGEDEFPLQWELRRGVVYRAVSYQDDILIRTPYSGRSYDLDLVFYAYVEEENVEGCRVASDQASLNIPVAHLDVNDAQIDSVSAEPAEVEPGQPTTVTVEGRYRVVEEGGIPLAVTLRIEGGQEYLHELGAAVQGSGTFSEEFQVESPPDEGEMRLEALVWRLDTVYIFDQEEASVAVRAGAGAERYLRITGVEVTPAGGGEPLQQVTPGQDFAVYLTLEWSLDHGGRFYAEILDASGVQQGPAIASEYMYYSRPASQEVPGVIWCVVEGFRIPPRDSLPDNGRWDLRANLYYQYSQPGGGFGALTLGDSLEFHVTVAGGGDRPAGGSSDWSITGISVSPIQPFQGSAVTFTARVEVSTRDTLPQNVAVSYSLDGAEQLRGCVTMEEGMAFVAVSSPAWTPTQGVHTVRWEVDPGREYDDPDRRNNARELRFTVAEAPRQPQGRPGGEQPAEEEFDYYVTATPTVQRARSQVAYKVSVGLVSGAPEPVMLGLEAAPAGVSWYFDPPSGTPGFNSTLTVTVAGDLPAGAYPMRIKAAGGGKEKHKPVTLVVEEGPDYAISLSPASVRAKPGETALLNVSVSSSTGYTRPVILQILGAPEGAGWRLEPRSSTPPFRSTLALELSQVVSPGAYKIVVTGSGPDSKKAAATLWVYSETPTPEEPVAAPTPSAWAYYSPLLYIIAPPAVVITAAVVARRRLGKRIRYCTECGAEIHPKEKFCASCGKPLKKGR